MFSSPSSSSSTPKKMITLQSSDGHRFDFEEKAALLSETLKQMMEQGRADEVIPIPNVNAECLAAVISYCKAHVESESEYVLKMYDGEFMRQCSQPTMLQLLLAANYLNVKGLVDLLCKGLAGTVQDAKNVEAVRHILGSMGL